MRSPRHSQSISAHALSIRVMPNPRFDICQPQCPHTVSVTHRAPFLLTELVAQCRAQVWEIEMEPHAEQALGVDALAGEQRFLAHLAEHELDRKLRNRRKGWTMQYRA